MAQFVAFSPKAEVNGETVLAVVSGMGALKDRALVILAEAGIKDPKPGGWHLQQHWLDAFKAIAQMAGPTTLCNIGRKIPECANFPPQIKTLDDALASIDMAYHGNHRNGEIGHYKFEKAGDKRRVMICENPYPCDFDRGIVEAMVKRFKPEGVISIRVEHDAKAPCRKTGGNSCTYIVSW